MARKFQITHAQGTKAEYVIDGEKVHRRLIDPNRNKIMDRNQELRKSAGAVKTTSFGKLELDIPLADMPMLESFYPGISNPSHPDHRWQLRRFMKSPASDPYRLQERKKGVNRG